MYTIYGIDSEGNEHGALWSDDRGPQTLEEAAACLEEVIMDGAMESLPDDPCFVRYGIIFDADHAMAICSALEGKPQRALRSE